MISPRRTWQEEKWNEETHECNAGANDPHNIVCIFEHSKVEYFTQRQRFLALLVSRELFLDKNACDDVCSKDNEAQHSISPFFTHFEFVIRR